eukprot:1156178-Pelagomonas_calceolata.AAC.3
MVKSGGQFVDLQASCGCLEGQMDGEFKEEQIDTLIWGAGRRVLGVVGGSGGQMMTGAYAKAQGKEAEEEIARAFSRSSKGKEAEEKIMQAFLWSSKDQRFERAALAKTWQCREELMQASHGLPRQQALLHTLQRHQWLNEQKVGNSVNPYLCCLLLQALSLFVLCVLGQSGVSQSRKGYQPDKEIALVSGSSGLLSKDSSLINNGSEDFILKGGRWVQCHYQTALNSGTRSLLSKESSLIQGRSGDLFDFCSEGRRCGARVEVVFLKQHTRE